jgi:hypothetical protein
MKEVYFPSAQTLPGFREAQITQISVTPGGLQGRNRSTASALAPLVLEDPYPPDGFAVPTTCATV